MWWTCMTTVVLPAPMVQCTIPMQLIQSYQMSPEAVDEISKIELTYIDLKWNSCIDLGMNLVSHITLCYKVWGFSIGQCFNHTVGHKLSERINAARIQMYEWNMLQIFQTKVKQTFGVTVRGRGGLPCQNQFDLAASKMSVSGASGIQQKSPLAGVCLSPNPLTPCVTTNPPLCHAMPPPPPPSTPPPYATY